MRGVQPLHGGEAATTVAVCRPTRLLALSRSRHLHTSSSSSSQPAGVRWEHRRHAHPALLCAATASEAPPPPPPPPSTTSSSRSLAETDALALGAGPVPSSLNHPGVYAIYDEQSRLQVTRDPRGSRQGLAGPRPWVQGIGTVAKYN